MNYSFGKKNWAELVNTSGAAGKWLITDEFSTDLDEMGIFVLSKDQTYRICATFLDSAKFSILVIHLIIRSFRIKILRNSGEIPMGIIDITSLSWSTRKVSKRKEVMILLYYESKHVNYTRSDDFSVDKK
jgi:hypothetical protein